MSLECLCDVFGKDKTAVRKAVGDFPDIEVEAMIVSREGIREPRSRPTWCALSMLGLPRCPLAPPAAGRAELA